MLERVHRPSLPSLNRVASSPAPSVVSPSQKPPQARFGHDFRNIPILPPQPPPIQREMEDEEALQGKMTLLAASAPSPLMENRSVVQCVWIHSAPTGISRWDTPIERIQEDESIDEIQWYRRASPRGYEYRWENIKTNAGSLFGGAASYPDIPEEITAEDFQQDQNTNLLQLDEDYADRVIPIEQIAGLGPISAFHGSANASVAIELLDPQKRSALSYTDSVFRFGNAALYDRHGYGAYTVVFRLLQNSAILAQQSVPFTVLGPGNPKAVSHGIPQGAQSIGSHWTSTVYDGIFQQHGLREAGNDACYGEGLYTTTDRNMGLVAGFGVVRAKGGLIREWRVYALPNQQLTSVQATEAMEWKATPYRNNPVVQNYVTNYDLIVNQANQEIKLNTRAFQKVIMALGDAIHPKDEMKTIQEHWNKALRKS